MASLTEAEEALSSTRAKANFKRLTRLLMRGGVKLLKETFDSIHSPADLPKKLSDPATENDLKKAKTSKKEWKALYPSPGMYGKSTEFDITLIFRLLRTICGLKPPSSGPSGWDDLPDDSNNSLEADLVRIKYYRNEVYGHKKTMEISDREFVDLWRKISVALIRIAANISPEKREGWKKAIDDFLTNPLTPEEERCVEELDRWYKQDMDVKNELEKLGDTMEERFTTLTEHIRAGFENIKEESRILREELKDRPEYLAGSGPVDIRVVNTIESITQPGLPRRRIPEAAGSSEGMNPDHERGEQAARSEAYSRSLQLNGETEIQIWDVILSFKKSFFLFLKYLEYKLNVFVRNHDVGSLLITVECSSLQALEGLWEDYRSEHLNKIAQEILITGEVLQKLGLTDVKLKTFISEEEYEKGKQIFSENSGTLQRDVNKAIPLCLPNNCHWNSTTSEFIKTNETRSSLNVVPEALQKLRTVKGPVCVVAIAGPYRKGKSYILSEAFEQPEVFPVGHHFDPETMGIWMWIVPQKFADSSGQECTVVLLDSEGIDAVRGEWGDRKQLFTLTVLLASVLIYNSAGVPTREDLNGLDFIVKLSQRTTFRSSYVRTSMRSRQEDTESFHKIFPFFIWLLRDVTQTLPPDCKDVKEFFLTRLFKAQGPSHVHLEKKQKVAESVLRFFPGFQAFKLPPPTFNEEVLRTMSRNRSQINPEFLSGIKQFKKLLRSMLVPKRSFNDGEIVTGEGLAALVQLYVDAINSPGEIPNVQSAWETFVETKCSDAVRAAFEAYDVIMKTRLSGRLPCNNEQIRKSHEAALDQALAQLQAETAGISTYTTEKFLIEFTEKTRKHLASWENENNRLTRDSCTDLLKWLKNEHLGSIIARLQRGESSKVTFEDIVAGYCRIEEDYKARATGARDVGAAVFFEFYPELMKEMQHYMDMLRKLKDFDEKMARELAAKASLEQEIFRLEEETVRLQQENRERHMEMEMLEAKQSEEKKRLREQMEAEAKAQRDQMENMMKASMKQAEEDRRTFMQENPALNERLAEMQKSNEKMQQMVESSRQKLLQRELELKKPPSTSSLPKCRLM